MALHALFHFNLHNGPECKSYCWPHFTDEGTALERLFCDLPHTIQLYVTTLGFELIQVKKKLYTHTYIVCVYTYTCIHIWFVYVHAARRTTYILVICIHTTRALTP